MKKGKKILLIILCVLLALIIAAVSTFFILRNIGKNSIHKGDQNIKAESVEIIDESTVTRNGKKYKLNPYVVSVLVMGIDKTSVNKDVISGKNGQADTLFVLTVDTMKKTFKIIPIQREAMVDINVYSTNNEFAGVSKKQICIAYAYGNTPKECSENTMLAVERLFYGININSYVTLDLNGVAKFTKMIDGVDVEAVGEPITVGKKTYQTGEKFTVSGDSAIDYIRSRGTDLYASSRRLERQKTFLKAVINKVSNQISDDFTKITSYYNTMIPYVSTDVTLPEITYIASESLVRDMGSKIEYKKIEGTYTGETVAEFYPDEESLLDILFDIYYNEVK